MRYDSPATAARSPPRFERAQELAERDVALAAHDDVDAPRRVLVDVGGEAWIVAPHDDGDAGLSVAHERDDLPRRAALKRHDRQADDVGIDLAHQSLDGLAHPPGDENQVGNGDPVVRIDVPRQRGERPVRHPHRDVGGVLEGIGHREEKDVHRPSLRTLSIALQRPIVASIPNIGGTDVAELT